MNAEEIYKSPEFVEFMNAPSVVLQIDRVTLTGMIGQLQLAMRHQDNVGLSRQRTERFVRDLIESLDPERGVVYQFLMMGFDPKFDS